MMTRVIVLANQKGGVGKTTTTINLAACLAETGRRILMIDLDPQSNATSGLGLRAEKGLSLYSALIGKGSAIELIRATGRENLDIIPAELDLAGAEVDVARMDGYLHCFARALEPVVASQTYDFIIVDCPPSLGILTMNALSAADSVIIPMQCEYYALEGLSVIVGVVNQLQTGGANPRLRIEGILMTMYDSRTRLAAQVVDEVRQHFPSLVYSTIIPRNVKLSEAPSHGEAVIQYDPSSVGARCYRMLAQELLTRQEVQPETAAAEPGPVPGTESASLPAPQGSQPASSSQV